MKEIIEFPSHKVCDNTEWKRSQKAKALKTDLQSKTPTEFKRRFQLVIPDVSVHSGHSIGENAGISQEIEPYLVQKIVMLVKQGVTTVNEMRRQLFANADLPSTTNRRYYPNTRIIRSHMVHAKRKQRYSMIDQECLVEKIKIWKEEQTNSKIFFRPTATESNDDMHENPNDDMCVDDDDAEIKLLSKNGGHFLFIYQSAEQRRLLSRYGNEISFLDATYRATRYTLPLFFLVVKTNVN
ncbi:uncharacterized protein LOC135693125 [Rhopilema esculentum]|uniref:uncharacterized protein LOC135693125 n=1 Tax=Rhopilema esculentum TaxID=499914 RepID=UPI0031DA286F